MMIKPPRILLVEDNSKEAELALMAFNHLNLADEVMHLHDGAEAMDYLYRRGAFVDWPPGQPVLVLSDLKMPKVDGLEVLRKIKSDPALKAIPVVIMSSSQEAKDVKASYALGVNAYIVKSVNFKAFAEAIKKIGEFWALLNEPPPSSSGDTHSLQR